MKETQRILLYGLILIFMITFACALVYAVAQQSIRQEANSRPAILANETLIKLEEGVNPNDAVPTRKIELSKSQEPFVMVLDNNWSTIASSAMIGNNKPAFPALATNDPTQDGEARITWEPQKGLRFATVTVKYSKGTIVAGISLKETEKLEDNIFYLTLYAWIAGVAFSEFMLWIITRSMIKRNAEK